MSKLTPWMSRTCCNRLVILLVAIGTAGSLSACTGNGLWRTDEPVFPVPGGRPEEGRAALLAYGCIGCHTIPGVSGTTRARVGPSLEDWANQEYIAGTLTNTPENLTRWIQNPQAIEPGTVMPTLGVSDADVRDMAAYLYTLDD